MIEKADSAELSAFCGSKVWMRYLVLLSASEPAAKALLGQLDHPPDHVSTDRPTGAGGDVAPVTPRGLNAQLVSYLVPELIESGSRLRHYRGVATLSSSH